MNRIQPVLFSFIVSGLAACSGLGADSSGAGTVCVHSFDQAVQLSFGGAALSVTPAVTALADGSFLAVLGEEEETGSYDYVGRWRRYEQGSGWSATANVGSSDTVQELELFPGTDLEAVAVWMQNSNDGEIFAGTWRDEAFVPPEQLGPSKYHYGVLDAAGDSHGRVRAAWEDHGHELSTRVYVPESGWSATEVVPVDFLRGHTVVADQDHGDFVIWVESVEAPDGIHLHAQRFDGPSMDGAPELIASHEADNIYSGDLAAVSSGSGDVWVAWIYGGFASGAPTDGLELFFFDGESETWSAPVTVVESGEGGSLDQLHLGVDSDGGGILLWASGQRQGLHYARLSGASVTESGKIFDGIVNLGDLAIHNDGILFAWASDGALMATCTNEDGSWATPTKLKTPAGTVSTPMVAARGDGAAAILWHHESGGTRTIHAMTSQ